VEVTLNKTPRTGEGFDLKVRSRASKPVTIHIPGATLASLEKTAEVLTRHIESKEEVSAILKEIRTESVS
jgi:hypothetical protein